MIAGVLLAAGLSRRMGRAKLLMPLEGRPVVRHAADRLVQGGIAPVVVVVGPDAPGVRAALTGLPVTFAVNPDPAAGQASSLIAGIRALPPEADAALVALGDQPFVPADVIRGLIEAFARGGAAIAAPRYREGLGNPVLFSASVFPELLALQGDRGARAVVERDPARVALVDFDLPMPQDVDTQADYDRLRAPPGPV